jgi:hypothetical protein
VAQGTHALEHGRWSRTRIPRRALVLLLVLAAIAIVGVYYAAVIGRAPASDATTTAQVRPPAGGLTVLRGTQADLAADMARVLFTTAPVVVVADPVRQATLATAAQDAQRRSAPLLLTSATRAAPGLLLTPAVETEIKSLHPGAVLAVGVSAPALAALLPSIKVVSTTTGLPPTGPPPPLRRTAVLERKVSGAGAMAAAVTARAAGAQVITMPGYDPRAYPEVITALAAARPQHVLALGAGFGAAASLSAKVAVAETGVQLPGGGQVMFPYRRLVAMYGAPGTYGLGVLGHQDLSASIVRVRAFAASYRALSKVPVVPTFEIIATVAQGSAGANGLYSYETPVADLRPWVKRATKDGLYVVLDLQPGRANLLTQAKLYASLLKLPDVGLALDPEWKLQPGQVPLRQIGSVSITEINSVITWLAKLTARYHLPQKLLVLHQFRLSMIQDEYALDTHHSDLAIVIHMDGQGTPGEKVQTWNAVLAAAPHGVFFGWKNFLVKDHPMMDPQETMDRTPQPVMISYQ